MARYLLNPVPDPPVLAFDEVYESWNLIRPVADRPTEPQTERDWENYFGVILRDAGQVAVIDGDSKELVTILDTGDAIHILRSSKDGRYYLAVGRDGKASLIDLCTEVPEVVAEARPCLDARSIESSKMEGYENDYVIEGCYWPPHFVIMDGLTLEPIKVVSTVAYEKGVGDRVDAARVAAIVASEHNPEWIVNVKQAGQSWLVDYSNLSNEGRPLVRRDLRRAARNACRSGARRRPPSYLADRLRQDAQKAPSSPIHTARTVRVSLELVLARECGSWASL